MFENPRRGRQARNFTTNVPKILDLKSSSEQIFSRKLSLGAPGKIRQVHTILPLLTDSVQKNVEVRKQLSFGRMGHAYSRRQNTQRSLETIETSGKGIPQNRRISWRQEKGLRSCSDRKNSPNS